MATIDLGIVVTAINRASRSLNTIAADTDKVDKSGRRAARGFRAIDVVFASIAAGSAIALAKSIVGVAASLEQAQVRLAFFEKSFAKGRETFNALRKEFQGVPIDTKTMLDGFSRLTAAGLDPLDGSLKTIVDSVSAFGGGTEEINRAIIAIQQIAGKGVVSMEELRQQLGEAVPFAIALMARETGRTIPQFIAAVENGAVSAREGIDAFIKGAEESFGGFSDLMANTITGSQARIQQAWEGLIDKVFGEFGLGTRIGIMFNVIAEEIDNIAASISQADVDKFVMFLEDVILFGAGVVQALGRIGLAVAKIFEIGVGLLGSAGGDILTSGLIGFFLFGKFGAIAGALLPVLARMSQGTGELINGMTAAVKRTLGSLAAAATFGLIGFLLFGPGGGLVVAAAAAALDQVLTLFRDFASKVATFFGFDEVAKDIENLFGSVDTSLFGNALVEGVQATSDVVNNSLSTGMDDLIKQTFEKSEGWKGINETLDKMLKSMNALNVEIQDGTDNAKKQKQELNEQLKLMRAQLTTADAIRRINELNREVGGIEISGFTEAARDAQLGFQREIEQTAIKIVELEKAMIGANEEQKAVYEQNIETLRTLQDTLQNASQQTTAEGLLAKETWEAIGNSIDSVAKTALADFAKGTLDLQSLQQRLWSSITDSAANYLIELIKITAQQHLFNAATAGGGGGGGGGALASIGAAFAGGFANGGIFPGGTSMNAGLVNGPTAFGIGGEAGAEVLSPLPTFQQLVGAARNNQGQTINLTVQAIDPQNGTEFLINNMETISEGLHARRNLNGGM